MDQPLDDIRYTSDRHLDGGDFLRLAGGDMSDMEEVEAAHHLDECLQCQVLFRGWLDKQEKTPIRRDRG